MRRLLIPQLTARHKLLFFFFCLFCKHQQVTDKQKELLRTSGCRPEKKKKKNSLTSGFAASENIERRGGSEKSEMDLWGNKAHGRHPLEATQFQFHRIRTQRGESKLFFAAHRGTEGKLSKTFVVLQLVDVPPLRSSVWKLPTSNGGAEVSGWVLFVGRIPMSLQYTNPKCFF